MRRRSMTGQEVQAGLGASFTASLRPQHFFIGAGPSGSGSALEPTLPTVPSYASGSHRVETGSAPSPAAFLQWQCSLLDGTRFFIGGRRWWQRPFKNSGAWPRSGGRVRLCFPGGSSSPLHLWQCCFTVRGCPTTQARNGRPGSSGRNPPPARIVSLLAAFLDWPLFFVGLVSLPFAAQP